jgi:glycosyltransferase involved in cell wall biosynthesis
MSHLICTVTNDLTHDQRMQRICTTLCQAGYRVTLVGRQLADSQPLAEYPYAQVRLRCRWHKGFLFYAEYNLRLFIFLWRTPCAAIGSVDLDTLPAGWAASLLRGRQRVFDAHEHFVEVPELQGRPMVQAVWRAVARVCLPAYRHAYTVGPALADLFSQKYGIEFRVVRNVPWASQSAFSPKKYDAHTSRVLLYQGALNDGRGIEEVMEALPMLPAEVEFWLAGEGDLSAALRRRATKLGLGERVRFFGWVHPDQLKTLTPQAWLGLNLLKAKGLSYQLSLANKFFDYTQAGVPTLTMAFEEYLRLQAEYPVAVLLADLSPAEVAAAVRHLLDAPTAYAAHVAACAAAREEWTWEREAAVLLEVWAAATPPCPPQRGRVGFFLSEKTS